VKGKIRILFLIDTISGPNGGTEKHVLELIDHLDQTKFQVYLGCLYQSQWLKDHAPACPQITLNFKGYWHPNFIWQVIKLVRFLKKENVQILQTFFLEANIIGMISTKFAKVPWTIASRRNIGHRNTPFKTQVLKFLSSATTAYLANCQKVKQVVIDQERVDPQKVRVIYNGVDPDRFSPGHSSTRAKLGLPEGKLIVGMVANLKKIKGIDFFLEAAGKITRKRRDVLFVIIGGEYEEEYYLNLRDNMGLKETVLFLGIKKDIEDYLRAFDVAINSSLTEGFSNSILEYMASGLAVVATDVGGNAEAVVDGQTGLIVPAADSEKLAEAIQNLLADKKLRRDMGEKGREKILANFTQEKMIRELEEFYLGLAHAF